MVDVAVKSNQRQQQGDIMLAPYQITGVVEQVEFQFGDTSGNRFYEISVKNTHGILARLLLCLDVMARSIRTIAK